MSDTGWQLVSDDVVCFESDSQLEAAALANVLRDAREWLDVVCGRNTVYAQFDLAQLTAEQALSRLATIEPLSLGQQDVARPIDIPACYEPAVAPDLIETCERLGLSRDELVKAHSGVSHAVAMLGFMPGFAYIDGLASSLHIDRLDEPRQHVAAGSIGIAGSQTGIYPFDGPGGWRLIARTPLRLFNPAAVPPALLTPLQKIRFVPITLNELNELDERGGRS